MGTTKLNIGKIPISKGEYQEGTAYQRLNQVTMLGSTYQSKIDDNTSAPAHMGADGAVENINTDKWLCIAVGNVSAAKKVVYNNETSGLEAGNVQEAIDELANKKADKTAVDAELAKKANTADVDTKFTEEKNRVDAELDKKFDKESIVQESGESEELVMSQKAVSDKLNDLQQKDSVQDLILAKKAEKSDISILKDLIRAATGMPQDLLDKMVEYNAVLEQAIPYIRNMSEITDSDIDKIIAGTYVPEQTNPTPSPDSDLISYVKAIDVKVTDTGKKLDQFIAYDLTTEQVNDLLDKQNDNINI